MVAPGVPDRIIMRIVSHTTGNMVSLNAHLAPDNLKGATGCLARAEASKEPTNATPSTPTLLNCRKPPGPGSSVG